MINRDEDSVNKRMDSITEYLIEFRSGSDSDKEFETEMSAYKNWQKEKQI